MKSKLVAITQPLIDGINNPKEFIVYAARVSNPSNQINTKTTDKLFKYLIKHKHWSPFEQVSLTIEVCIPRDISRQALRHSFKPQEFSQRYADPTEDLGFIIRETRFQDKTNRQNSIEPTDYQEFDANKIKSICMEWEERQKALIDIVEENYKWAIQNNIAKECARVVLPEGLTLSKLYLTNNLRNWIHYCKSRTNLDTQKEHREIAIECWKVILSQFPELSEIEIEI